MNLSMEQQWRTGHLSGGSAEYVEGMYEAFLRDADAVPGQWREFFKSLPAVNGDGGGNGADLSHVRIRDDFRAFALNGGSTPHAPALSGEAAADSEHERKQVHVTHLISSYRERGHQKAALDPLGIMPRQRVPDLELGFHNLSPMDRGIVFQTASLFSRRDKAPLGDIMDTLERIYCSSIGYEFMHIVDLAEKQWIQKRIEEDDGVLSFSPEVKRHLLERLTAAEGLEKHLDAKYPGTKRFGLEGGESLIPALDELVQRAGGYGVKEIVLGMAHRGRLNVLVNILGKNPANLFDEFEGKAVYVSSGDVKYHQGFSSNISTGGGEVHIALAFNPSHLEIVAPVVEGSVRARQDRRASGDSKSRRNNGGHANGEEEVLPVLIHGDAAFAGQGVVMETFQMSQTRAFRTGGTVHIIVNNQLGFTTSRREDARSTEYCTDVAKMVQAPIFHVNADDPEAVLFVTQLALDFRRAFNKDAVIDLVCYRRRGHNETDEPSITQPLMYDAIRRHKPTRALYAEKLAAEGTVDGAEADAMARDYRAALDTGRHVAKSLVTEPAAAMFVDWRPYLGHDWVPEFDTAMPLSDLQDLARTLAQPPKNFTAQRQVARLFTERQRMAAAEAPVDWGFAETLAYASLLAAGHRVRITGQDVGRGTFAHRHAIVYDKATAEAVIPLQSLTSAASLTSAPFHIYDSLLSEEAVLAFEYGYATTTPDALVVWEAQFGDFANSAQVVIDQFITSGEHKWQRLCGLTLLLPHGYEGQGPEHSSARLERFLQLCAQHNIQVCQPTTAGQIFHLLRKQVLCPLRKPLVVMSPKSLLRHKDTGSSLKEMAAGGFQTVLDEIDDIAADKARRVIICSGKVYYDLRAERRARGMDDIAIIRLEQLYPFPHEVFDPCLLAYREAREILWCQEEPMNQGPWYSIQHHLRRPLERDFPGIQLGYAGRESSAAAAAGYPALHASQQEQFINQALS